jgi:DNA-binding IclR family transcriptional regulator
MKVAGNRHAGNRVPAQRVSTVYNVAVKLGGGVILSPCLDASSSLKKAALKPATTVTKVCRIIEEFRDRKSLGVTDLARRTTLLPSDVHRILASLRANGYVDQDPETKKYRLGFALVRLGLTAFQRNELREKAQPILVRLSRQIGASMHLGIFDRRELEIVMIDQIDASTDNMFRAQLGGAVQLHCTALGKTILASLDGHTALGALERSTLRRNTARTIIDIAILKTELEQIRRQGYAVDRDECTVGASCIGSPVRDDTGAVVGAISTSMPTSLFLTWDESRLSARLKAAAFTVSAALGAG